MPQFPCYAGQVNVTSVTLDLPNGAHQNVHEEEVLLGGNVGASVPDLVITSLHETLFQADGMLDINVALDLVRFNQFQLRVEVGDAAQRKQAQQVESEDGEHAL